jgi:hypothetical protein
MDYTNQAVSLRMGSFSKERNGGESGGMPPKIGSGYIGDLLLGCN